MPRLSRNRPIVARQTVPGRDTAYVRRITRLRNLAIVALVVAVAVLVAVGVTNGFSSSPSTQSVTTTTEPAKSDQQLQVIANRVASQRNCPASPHAHVNTLTWNAAPPVTINPTATYTATFATTLGGFIVTLDAKHATQAVNNFIYLANQHFFTCVTFDQVLPGMFDATGDPTGSGSGGPGYTIAAENVPTKYAPGDVVMTRSAAGTSGSQFLVVVHKEPVTLTNGSSLFGTVTSGIDVLDQINKEGNTTSAKDGRTPLVVHRILGITIHQS